MIDVIKRTLLAGVGAAVVTKEKIESSLEEFVRQGKVSSEEARKMAQKISEEGRHEFEEASRTLGERIRELLNRSDEQTRARLAVLEARIQILEEQAAAPKRSTDS